MGNVLGILLLVIPLAAACGSTSQTRVPPWPVTPTEPVMPPTPSTPAASTGPKVDDETFELAADTSKTSKSGFTLTLAEPASENAAPNKDPDHISMPAIYRLDVLLTVTRNGVSETLHFSPPRPGTVTQDRNDWQGYAFQLLDVRYIGGKAQVSFRISSL
ncbi:hypothetical protein BH11MYX2_BH11MYX2_19500 [soil metagenome]